MDMKFGCSADGFGFERDIQVERDVSHAGLFEVRVGMIVRLARECDEACEQRE